MLKTKVAGSSETFIPINQYYMASHLTIFCTFFILAFQTLLCCDVCVHVFNHLRLFASLKLIYICAYILNQKMEERNIRKENVGKRKEKESDQMLLTAMKERGIQIEGTGEEYVSLTGSAEQHCNSFQTCSR
jgi:ABC-type iron transport system FetAB permease component